MYKIMVRNIQTCETWWEYGFAKYIMSRINYYFNATDDNCYLLYEVIDCLKLIKNLSVFKKCWKHKIEFIIKEK